MTDSNLQKDIAALNARMNHTETRMKRAETRLKTVYALAFIAVVAAFSLGTAKDSIAQGYGVTLAQLATRMTAVETKTAFITTDGNATDGGNMYITNANLHVRSGSGATNGRVNGRGNLIIGYNEVFGTAGDERTGSHNLVIGRAHDYTSYGGIVAGLRNRITAESASVLGGQENEATGMQAVVINGIQNDASGVASTVLSGLSNTATNTDSTVIGGNANSARGEASVVGGGNNNIATGRNSVVSGGASQTISTLNGWVAGVSATGRTVFTGVFSSP